MALEETGADSSQPSDSEHSELYQFVTFMLAGECYALPMAPVQEIIRPPVVTRLPLTSNSMLGLANLRGRVLPIISMRTLFGLELSADNDAQRVLVIQHGNAIGFVVDRVASVRLIEPQQMESVETLQSCIDQKFLSAVVKETDGSLIMVLDVAALIQQEFQLFAAMAHQDMTLLQSEQHQQHELEHEDDATLELVSFHLAEQEFAVPIRGVQCIVQQPEHISQVPGSNSIFMGLMVLREQLLPLVSLRGLLGLPLQSSQSAQRVIVLSSDDLQQIGIVTDSVDQVLRLALDALEPLPSIIQLQQNSLLAGICRLAKGERLVSVLDVALLFSHAGMQTALKQAQIAEQHMQISNQEEQDFVQDDTQYVVFKLAQEEFAVPIMSVHEILRVPENLVRVPKAPSGVEGLMNLRGTVLPVIDKRSRLGMAAMTRSDRQRILVYAYGEQRIGFIVDAVREVRRIDSNHLTAAPKLSEAQAKIVKQVANLENEQRIVLMIDPHTLLGQGELSELTACLA